MPANYVAAYTVFVTDKSGSMSDPDYLPSRYLAAIQAAEEYISARLQHSHHDLIGAVLFDDRAKVISKAVPISQAIERVLIPMKQTSPAHGTDLNQGLIQACHLFANHTNHQQKRIVMLTDGNGGHPIRTAQKLKNQGVIIDVIGIAGNREDVNEPCLKKVASVVNGELRYRFIRDKASLLTHFKTIATDLVMVR